MFSEIELLSVGTVAIALFGSAYFLLPSLYSSKKYPPILEESLFSIIEKLQAGNPIFTAYMNAALKYGPVFRVRMPELRWHYIVVEPKLVRLILEGTKNVKGAEKYKYYKALAPITAGFLSVFIKNTFGDGWDWARKGIAPGLAPSNFQKNIEQFCSVIRRTTAILDEYLAKAASFDLSELITRLTFDTLTTALFQIDYNTLQDINSIGNMFLEEDKLVMKEFALKQVYNPIRWMMFWDKELRRAHQARSNVHKFLRDVLNDYKLSKSKEEIAVDKSLMGLLSKR